jgi:hypothetical protein
MKRLPFEPIVLPGWCKFLKNEASYKGRHVGFSRYPKTCLLCHREPFPAGKEMQEARSKRQEIPPVAQMFDKHNATALPERAPDLAEQPNSRCVIAQFVGRQDEKHSVAFTILKRQLERLTRSGAIAFCARRRARSIEGSLIFEARKMSRILRRAFGNSRISEALVSSRPA